MDKDSCQGCGGRGFTVKSKEREEHSMVVYDDVITDCGECAGSFYATIKAPQPKPIRWTERVLVKMLKELSDEGREG